MVLKIAALRNLEN